MWAMSCHLLRDGVDLDNDVHLYYIAMIHAIECGYRTLLTPEREYQVGPPLVGVPNEER